MDSIMFLTHLTPKFTNRQVRILLLSLLVLFTTGCATARPPDQPIKDPFERANRVVFSFNDKVDRWALKPVATGYRKITPTFIRIGINNFFENLDDVSTAINGLLQGKFKQGFSDTARFAINTTIGVVGIFDVATKLDFDKHSEDFGQTLGVWGFAEGPFLTLPFFGPQTLRLSLIHI